MLNELSEPQWIVIFNANALLKMKMLFSIYLTLGFSLCLFSQGTVTGNIRDENGNPM
jgi:hypothetical protein